MVGVAVGVGEGEDVTVGVFVGVGVSVSDGEGEGVAVRIGGGVKDGVTGRRVVEGILCQSCCPDLKSSAPASEGK